MQLQAHSQVAFRACSPSTPPVLQCVLSHPHLCSRHDTGPQSTTYPSTETCISAASPVRRRRWVTCQSASAFVQDPADIIPDAYDSDEEEDPHKRRPASTPVVLVGAGPVGLITAMYLARRGYTVQVFEQQPPPHEREETADYPLVLSARALLALEELGATQLLQYLANRPLKGRWWMGETPPHHAISTATPIPAATGAPSASSNRAGVVAPAFNGVATQAAGAAGGSNGAMLEVYPGHDQRFTRRVLVSRRDLEIMLADEAKRLFPDNIQFFYWWKFKGVNWDKQHALVECVHPGPVEKGDSAMVTVKAETAATEPDELWVQYGLLVGADGADSTVRQALGHKRPKVTDFDVQRPMRDTRQLKTFTCLRQVPDQGEVVPDMHAHMPGEYEYVYERAGAPSLRMWVADYGYLTGTITHLGNWDAVALDSTLEQAYGSSLPGEWRQRIVEQTCGPLAPAPRMWASTVQCSQFHGPRVALVGDAAHAMTGEYDQGISCAIEGVRLLNLALKSANDNIDKSLNIYSEVRSEDVHSMQQLEFFKRSGAPGLQYGDWVHQLAGRVGVLVWRCAQLMMAVARTWLPHRFPATYITDRLWDARRGYSDLFKVLVRFAAVPLIAALALMVLAARAALAPRFSM